MKAAFVEKYGPPEVVQIRETPRPLPGEGEILVKSHATTVNSGDARVRALRDPGGMKLLMRFALGFTKPKQPVIGFDVAGEVAEIGVGVTGLKVGDRVLASNRFKFGCHAEYVLIDSDGVAVKIPDNLTYIDAIALPFGGATSLVFFEAGGLKAGDALLINGASGAVGVMAIQLAKLMGAEVTAVCSGANAALVRELGADHVIDYTTNDFTGQSTRYDLIMDTHGNAPYARVRHVLKPGGRFLMVIGNLWEMISGGWQKAVVSPRDDKAAVSVKNYAYLLDLASKGEIKPVVDHVYPFPDIVEAHRRVDGGHKVGSVVVSFDEN
ncbi:MAG: NAD(P)-dependent alcohol dehydrogenase [Hyphomicrobiaceae bacterium]|nr:NAD(P)-dependent alcohol dehydrogenase [Hyphomicrobiaceae bacterium]